MANGPVQEVMRQIRQTAARPTFDSQTDEELLAHFLSRREEEAFALLVRRHGPMVLGLCLRLLRHRQDAEDAFQATFVMLVRKGHTIRRNGAMASWLYRVAFRIALRQKSKTDRYKCVDVLGDIPVEADPVAAAGWRELRPVLDQEVRRLPVKYRTPMILCYLEGKTYDEVARQIGCPKGTVAIRLLRGRAMLKARLMRRGLVAAAGCVGACAVLPMARAAVPPALAMSTANFGVAIAAGVALGSCVPATVVELVREAGRTSWIRKASVVCAAAVTLAMSGIGHKSVTPQETFTIASAPAVASQPAKAPAPQDQAPAAAPRVDNRAIAQALPPANPQKTAKFYPATIVSLRINRDEYTAGSSSPRRTTRCQHSLTIWSGEEDLAEIGAVVDGPVEGEPITVVIVRSERPRAHIIGASGLACRERMTNESPLLAGPNCPNDDTPPALANNHGPKCQTFFQAILTFEECQVYIVDGTMHIVHSARLDG